MLQNRDNLGPQQPQTGINTFVNTLEAMDRPKGNAKTVVVILNWESTNLTNRN